MADFQVVDVFTQQTFAGNPTCVCFPPSSASVDEAWMSKVARETSQPTTSFVDDTKSSFRTFSAKGEELPLLSGHSSLGIAAALTMRNGEQQHSLSSKYGQVSLTSDGKVCEIAFPEGSGELVGAAALEPLAKALGVREADVRAHGSFMGGKFCFLELSAESLASQARESETLWGAHLAA